MKRILAASLAASALALLSAPRAHSQAAPTASRSFGVSAFAGGSGVYTGLNGGRNVSFTAGLDVGFRRFFSLDPSLEVRGTYPIDDGITDSQKNVLGGLKLARSYGRFNPYADILFGRGEITYINGFVNPAATVEYLQNPTNVFSPGAGVDIDLTPRFALKLDAQYQRYSTPVTTSGTLWSTPLTAGLVYRFGIGGRRF